MPAHRQPFDPSRFTGIADCGLLIGESVDGGNGGNGKPIGFKLEFRLSGDRSGHFIIGMGDGRRSFSIALGAAEWKEFRAIIAEGERVFRVLTESGQCDELAPVV